MNNDIYELAIIGGGPAGVSAGVYAARKKLKTVFLTFDFESQSAVSENIQNWIGTPSISGADFAKSLENHLKTYAGECLEIKTGVKATDIKTRLPSPAGSEHGGQETEAGFTIITTEGEFNAKAVLIATGSTRRKLEAKGADVFEHKGLTYCATCDGPLYGDADVIVVGGGNAAFETAAQLSAYAKSVTLINRSENFRADAITVEKVLAKPNVKAIKNAVPFEVKGDKFVNGFSYKDAITGEIIDIPVTGIFIEIGLIPSTAFAKNIVELNQSGQIIVDPRTQQTKTPMIWAAGDCTDGLYHQNNISSGDAVKALEDIYIHLHTK
ncbi:MAG: FAD-dependent oxidoreductase [Candidatus Paceibacterota bacterium]